MSELLLYVDDYPKEIFVTNTLRYWYRLFIISLNENEGSETKQEYKLKYVMQKHHKLMYSKTLSLFPEDAADKIRQLGEKFPNFSGISDQIIKQIMLSNLVNHGVATLPHILLVGPPGTGKTVFAKKIIEILSCNEVRVNFGMIGAAFELAGINMAWESGDAGLFAKELAQSNNANIFFLADELDKGNKENSKYGSPFNVLYQVWEKSAKEFKDEGLELDIDLSYCTWICTANDLDVIPEALQSRLHVIHVPLPSKNEMRTVCQSIWHDLLTENDWDCLFCNILSEDVIDKLILYSPRDVYKTLKLSVANAVHRYHSLDKTHIKKDNNIHLESRDIFTNEQIKVKNRIGFV